jgi:hypothetical protein
MPVPRVGVFLAARDGLDYAAAGEERPAAASAAAVTGPTETAATAPLAAIPHHLAVVKVELLDLTVTDAEQWWMSVDWESLWSKRIKLRG